MSSRENLVNDYRSEASNKKQQAPLNFQVRCPQKQGTYRGLGEFCSFTRERPTLEAAGRELPVLHSLLLPPAGILIFWAWKTRLPRRQFPDAGLPLFGTHFLELTALLFLKPSCVLRPYESEIPASVSLCC